MTTDPALPAFDESPSKAQPSMAEQVSRALAPTLVKWAAGMLATGMLMLGGTSLAFYTSTHADGARAEEVHRTLQRDVTGLAGDVEDHAHPEIAEDISEIRTDLATLRTKIMDMGDDIDDIERLLDERLPPRRRPR